MDQRSIIMFLHPKEFSTKDVHTELVQVLGSDDDAIAYLTVTKYIRNDVILQNDPEPESKDRAEDSPQSLRSSKTSLAIMSNELLKLLESTKHHSWKYIVMLDETWFYLFIFLLITNQIGSVHKMKLHKGREKLCHLRR
jgi:hypothetical protein